MYTRVMRLINKHDVTEWIAACTSVDGGSRQKRWEVWLMQLWSTKEMFEHSAVCIGDQTPRLATVDYEFAFRPAASSRTRVPLPF